MCYAVFLTSNSRNISDYIDIDDKNQVLFTPHKLEKLYRILYYAGCRSVMIGKRMVYFVLHDDCCQLIKYNSLRSAIYRYLRDSDFKDMPDRYIEILNAFHAAKGILNNDLLNDIIEVKVSSLSEDQIISLKTKLSYRSYSMLRLNYDNISY